MSNVENGGPAFPVSTRVGEVDDNPHGYGHQDTASTWQFPGMTLRDYLAAKAMQGALAAGAEDQMRGYEGWREEFSREAYRYADAMLAAREAKL